MLDSFAGAWSSLGQVSGLTITATLVVLAVSLALWTMVRPSRFPPGPRGLPIVGAIFEMTDNPEIIFERWAKKYGNVFGLKIGERWMVVLNGQEAIKDALLKQGTDFAGRPDLYSFELFTGGFKDIVFSSYSETWKLHRKLGHTALRHFATGKPLQGLITSMYPKIEKELTENGDRPIDPKLLITLLMFNIVSQMCFGKSYNLKDPAVLKIKALFDESYDGFGLGLAADFFSWARYIPTSGVRKMTRIIDDFCHQVREEVRGVKEGYDSENINNIYSLLMKAQGDARENGERVDELTDTHLFQTLNDIFSASIETSVATFYWALALMSEYPEIQCKAQKEIDGVVGRDRVATIEDRENLPYTVATLYEVMRYSSAFPTSLPHSTMTDVEFHGYHIPKGTMVMINVYSMHFDPNAWDEPESFKPEHFLDETGTVRQHPPGFLPFGAGRRSCLGEAVAKADLFLIFTWFLQNYSFSKVPGMDTKSLINMIPKTAVGRHLLPFEIIIKQRD